MKTNASAKIESSSKQRDELLAALKARIEQNLGRHPGLVWAKVQSRICGTDKLWSLAEMERTGGEPDVVGHDKKSGKFVFMDCAGKSGRPAQRLFRPQGWLSRKEARPKTKAMDLATEMGVALLTEEEYLALQKLGEFDKKTSSWIATPAVFRKQGGALWGGRSYGRVFIGCNGAQSYYAARGFRGMLRA